MPQESRLPCLKSPTGALPMPALWKSNGTTTVSYPHTLERGCPGFAGFAKLGTTDLAACSFVTYPTWHAVLHLAGGQQAPSPLRRGISPLHHHEAKDLEDRVKRPARQLFRRCAGEKH